MSRKAKAAAERPCQIFEFLLRTSRGTQVFTYLVPGEVEQQITDPISTSGIPGNARFLQFTTSAGRIVHLNLRYLIGVSRFDVPTHAGDQRPLPADPALGPLGVQGWQGLGAASNPPDLVLFIDGIEEPLVITSAERKEMELAAAMMDVEPESAIVHFHDDEFLRTRFLAVRNIIVMDSKKFYSTHRD